jgi:hypothetical protein
MFGAYAALQTAVVIESLLVWQFKRRYLKSQQQTQGVFHYFLVFFFLLFIVISVHL